MAESALKPVAGKLSIGGATDGTKIGNVGDRLKVDAVVSSSTSYELQNLYDESLTVSSGVDTDIIAQVVPAGKNWYIGKVQLAGSNIAKYTIKKDASVIGRTYTYFGGALSGLLDYSSFNGLGLKFLAGETIYVSVIHSRPSTGDFNCNIQYIEVSV